MVNILLKRGSEVAVSQYTGPAGEIVLDLDNMVPRLQDGVTMGGHVIRAETVEAPFITSPANGTEASQQTILMANPMTGGILHTGTVWEIARDPQFTTVVYTSGVSAQWLTYLDLAAIGVTLEAGTHYVRVKYSTLGGLSSEWSTGVYQLNIKVDPDTTGSPGPTILLAGDETLGFFGEVPASELITGPDLAAALGLTAGTPQFNNEPWLKYMIDGEVRFVAKKSLRYGISWNQINAVNAVFGGRTVEIGGITYKVQLMQGGNANPAHASTGYDPVTSHDSEWNRLFYRLHSGVHININNKTTSEEPFERWANYSDTALTVYNNNAGSHTWCQETFGGDSTLRVLRGYLGVSLLGALAASVVDTINGWRPVLVPLV